MRDEPVKNVPSNLILLNIIVVVHVTFKRMVTLVNANNNTLGLFTGKLYYETYYRRNDRRVNTTTRNSLSVFLISGECHDVTGSLLAGECTYGMMPALLGSMQIELKKR